MPLQRIIYEPWEYWPVERNWSRTYRGVTCTPSRARYKSYLYEMREEYRVRNRYILDSPSLSGSVCWLSYVYLFNSAHSFDPAPVQALFGDTTISLSCLNDNNLNLEFFFRYKVSRGEIIEINENDPEELFLRHPKTGDRMMDICRQYSPTQGSSLLREIQKERENLEITPFFAHLSSLVDRAVSERSSFEIFARHFDLTHAVDLGWRERPYEGVLPEPAPLRELESKEIFTERLSSWFYEGNYYSNLFVSDAEVILEEIGLEEVPPTPNETIKARIRYMDESYTYPDTFRESRILYGAEAKLLTLFPPGTLIEREEAEEKILKRRNLL
ncbi:MAG TPA: hypothetical protein ENI32_00375 [Candidatus Syntrophoarchaeum butanivorans]|uniref:Uncharacterized protein n=1 Tax=Candidatus Syntropharchaeum butanivorans TaxID=1839936 RepID=A0A1F2P6R6_9EURY|nr:MAG: hypothetical protein SBU_000191 [Candidatus Syntrophoarchaeum butanivorans]HEC56335.1 hypothetical protein [Candidatus Syntrophoarchaeum butanivorans]